MELDKNYWESRYRENSTGWDIGYISSPFRKYIDQLKDRTIRILIPGGGNSYEAEYIFNRGFKNIYIVDLSETALLNLKKRDPQFPASHLIQGDFFDLEMQFDLILEQTFFCAIRKNLREKYVKKMNELLSNEGKLVGLLFDAPLYDDHPPFGGDRTEYENCFKPYLK